MEHNVTIWRMGQFYKVESSNTKIIRQLANADDCKVGASYWEKERLVALDAILPFKAKFGRRIFRVLKAKGYPTPSKWPNLAQDSVLTIKRGVMASEAETGLEGADGAE